MSTSVLFKTRGKRCQGKRIIRTKHEDKFTGTPFAREISRQEVMENVWMERQNREALPLHQMLGAPMLQKSV